MSKIKFIIWSSALIVILGLFSQVKAFSVQLAPARGQYTLQPGDTVEHTLQLTNKSTEIVSAEIFSQDFTFKDSSGTPLFLDVTPDQKTSLAYWIRGPNRIILNPQETQLVPFKIMVPENIPAGGYYAAIFVKQILNEDQQKQVRTAAKMGSLLFIRVEGEGLTEKAEITDFYISKAQDNNQDVLEITALIHNQGNVHLQPQGRINLVDKDGNFVSDLDVKSEQSRNGQAVGNKKIPYLIFNKQQGIILPNQKREFKLKIDSEILQEGWHQSYLEIEYGQNKSQLRSKNFPILIEKKVVPTSTEWWKFGLKIGGIVFIVILGVVLRKRRRKWKA